ncbi:S8 family peptidase [Metabacillus iocasae]|uniref:Minor extracellular protease Epr n=1 Tax=Priestia iocasae TaxID=2291674 RepID=A0ABS2QRP6_9BACI|nr:S8 family peptidase [Metabacillus iocasae]MBM7702133.1 minor extracellular protease Epr [Metabacillus iocasae]
MKKVKNVLLSLTVATGVMLPTSALADQASEKKEGVIIGFKQHVNEQAIVQVNGKIKKKLKTLPIAVAELSKSEQKALAKNPNVAYIEKDIQISIAADTQDWGIPKVKAPVSWDNGLTGQGVKVAVIDTGIATNHPDLRVAGGASFVSYTDSYNDDNGHGTHVAGIIGSLKNDTGTIGVAYDADIYGVKVLEENGSGSLSSIVEGIDWTIANDMDIINLSLGTSIGSTALKEAVDRAYQSGIVVVAAAGNSGNILGLGDTVNYPAKYDSAIAVGATDQSDRRASFSSHGSAVEIAAPGEGIYSTYLNGGYATLSGTSMASPYAAGVLALYKQKYPMYTNVQLRQLLATQSVDLGSTGRDRYYGHGLAQAEGF